MAKSDETVRKTASKAQFAAAPQLIFAASSAKLDSFFFGGIMTLNGKRGDNMATSSITANFYCDDAKAANTFVDLLLSEKPPAKWVAPVPTGTAHEFRNKREVANFVKRVVRARRSRVGA
jgi:hypothetical protein